MFLDSLILLIITLPAIENRTVGVRHFSTTNIKAMTMEPPVDLMQSAGNHVDPNLQDIQGKWYLVYVSPSTATFYQSIPHCHVCYIYPENDQNDKFVMWEAFRQSFIKSTWISYKRSAMKYSPGQYWLTTEHQFYPQQFNIAKLGPSVSDRSQTPANYQYFIATDNGNLGFSVFAREPEIFFQIFDREVREYLEMNNFGVKDKYFWFRPITVYHRAENCPYPSETEIKFWKDPVQSVQQMLDSQPAFKNCTPTPDVASVPKFQPRLVQPPEVEVVPENKINVLDAVRRKLPPSGIKDQELIVQPKRIVNNFNLFGSIFGP